MEQNSLMEKLVINEGFQYKIGMEIGLVDPISESKEDVEWYTIVYMEADPDFDLPICFLYLKSDDELKNIHQKLVNNTVIAYADITTSIEDNIVIP